ncbi:macrolide 2'-phosphotransferase [Arthrobacter sp. MYb227]|uniref:macrolide 2'-phosphotransferase n=1 Tax=Arthrobacter sp. MYb227 TaxID=1848601 RepID=UPI0021589098|nr:phosphotransferase [Arthrobacter sp. MYb227]
MKRSPMELAAIATAAVPGLAPTGVASLPDDADDFDSVLIVDAAKNRWRVRSPRHEEASIRLESELAALRAFSAGIRASLPFQLPSVAGTVRQGSLRTFVYNHLPGKQYSLEDLVGLGSRCAKDLGAVMAAIHSMPESAIDRADLPSYSSEQVRQRRLNELDAAATTGMIPARLLRRWEHALEDVALWRFNATVIHGDLHEDQLLVEDSKVVAVTGWTDLQVGDPADDFAWLAAVHEQSFADAAFESYVAVRGDRADPHIMRRAALAAEFALAQWLVKAISGGDSQRVSEAKTMLEELDTDIAEYGGQPISVVEPPRMTRPAPSVVAPAPVTASARSGSSPASGPSAASAPSAPSPVAAARSAVPVTQIPSNNQVSAAEESEPATNAMRIVPAPVTAVPGTPAPPVQAPKPVAASSAIPAKPTTTPAVPSSPTENPTSTEVDPDTTAIPIQPDDSK